MSINDKLAARRKELADEAALLASEAAKLERVKLQLEVAARKEKELQALAAKKAEIEALNAKVEQRLVEKGLTSLATAETSETKVDAAVERLISDAASKRMTSGENTTFAIFMISGLLSFFIAWPLAVFILICGGFYINKVTQKYKAQILTEGASVKVEQANGRLSSKQSEDPAASPRTDA